MTLLDDASSLWNEIRHSVRGRLDPRDSQRLMEKRKSCLVVVSVATLRTELVSTRYQVLTAVSMNMSVNWDAVPCSIVVSKGSTSETSVTFNKITRRNLPEDNILICNITPRNWSQVQASMWVWAWG
jgi:hypothetical protein